MITYFLGISALIIGTGIYILVNQLSQKQARNKFSIAYFFYYAGLIVTLIIVWSIYFLIQLL